MPLKILGGVEDRTYLRQRDRIVIVRLCSPSTLSEVEVSQLQSFHLAIEGLFVHLEDFRGL